MAVGGYAQTLLSEDAPRCGGVTYEGEQMLTPKENTFNVTVDSGYEVLRVLKNGEEVTRNADGSYPLEKSESGNTYYSVVTAPTSGWYVQPENMRIHFDGYWNDKYHAASTQTPSIIEWSDLSGNNNNGTLKSFDGTSSSGWDGKGLTFDGIDDIVTFPGEINGTEYTFEIYICVDRDQRGYWPRLTAEGPYYPCFYLDGTSGADNTVSTRDVRQVHMYAHGVNNTCGNVMTADGKALVQLDFTYDTAEQCVKEYINGEYKGQYRNSSVWRDAESIATASIGNRINDNTRTLKGSYYSFILYDKALSADEVAKNYEVNKARFGETR